MLANSQSLLLSLLATTAAAQTTSSTASVTSTSGVSIPSGCSAPDTYQMTAFNWFNSTHNLDCVNPNYPAGSTVCWESVDGTTTLCDPAADPVNCTTCVPYCYTGLPSVAYQPLGFGPPDTISIVTNGGSCSAALSTGFRDSEIGSGHFTCGTAADVMGFYGDSDLDSGNTGSMYYKPYGVYCGSADTSLSQPIYGAEFPLICSRDAGGNATCTTTVPVTLALTGFT